MRYWILAFYPPCLHLSIFGVEICDCSCKPQCNLGVLLSEPENAVFWNIYTTYGECKVEVRLWQLTSECQAHFDRNILFHRSHSWTCPSLAPHHWLCFSSAIVWMDLDSKNIFVGIYLVLFARNMIFHQFRTSAVDLANVAEKASLILLRFHLQRKQKNDNYMHKLITFFVWGFPLRCIPSAP